MKCGSTTVQKGPTVAFTGQQSTLLYSWQPYPHTQNKKDICYCIFTATMVTRMNHNVLLYKYCLSCYNTFFFVHAVVTSTCSSYDHNGIF